MRTDTAKDRAQSARDRQERYVILGDLARGATARVRRAYDRELRREVALKEFDADHLARYSLEQLHAEARALAKLAHQNVVCVYDVETAPSGQVWLVMEYVAGLSLDLWTKESRRTWREILVVFAGAGRGLAAAHAAGLIHRDFKPGDVLIGTDGTVKVVDFGLASSIAKTITRTQESRKLHPNPRSLSGDGGTAEQLSPATDQFAYCALLWEALYGRPPWGDNRRPDDEGVGLVPGPCPGLPKAVARALVRGLSVNPSERWPSLRALVDVLERHAYPPTRGRTFATWGLAATAAGIGVVGWSLDPGTAPCQGARRQLGSSWDATRRNGVQAAIASIGRTYSDEVWRRTENTLDQYADAWVGMYTQACEATNIRKEQSAQVMDLRMRCLRRANVRLDAVSTLLLEADDSVVANAHEAIQSLPPLSRCADIPALLSRTELPMPHELAAVETIEASLARASAASQAGRHAEALSEVDVAKEIMERGVRYEPIRAEILLVEAEANSTYGNYAESERTLRAGLAAAAKSHQSALSWEFANSLVHLLGLQNNAQPTNGLQFVELARGLAATPYESAYVYRSLAILRSSLGQYQAAVDNLAKAVSQLEFAIGTQSPEVASFHLDLAIAHRVQANFPEAQREAELALSLYQTTLGPAHPNVATTLGSLGTIFSGMGRFEQARITIRKGLAIAAAAGGPHDPSIPWMRQDLAVSFGRSGNHAAAEVEFRRALAELEALDGEHPDIATFQSNVAVSLHGQDKDVEAEVMHRRALAVRETRLGSAHPVVAESHFNLATSLAGQGKNVEAESHFRVALETFVAALDDKHPVIAGVRGELARLLLVLHRPQEARVFAELAWEQRDRDDLHLEDKADNVHNLAEALWSIDRDDQQRARAVALVNETLAKLDPAEHQHAVGILEQWLRDHR